MRRIISTVLAGLAALAASVAWTSHAASSTVLDPRRSGQVAEALSRDPAVREAIEDALTQALVSALPSGSPVPDADVRAAAARALDDPRVAEVVRTAIIDAHRRLVGEAEGPVGVDAGPIAAAGHDALLAAHPDLAGAVPAPPPLAVSLPTGAFPDLGWLREAAAGATGPAARVAAGLFAAALLVAADRARILRRAGFWALWAGAGWVLLGWIGPWVVSRYSVDGRLGVLGSLGLAVTGPMVAPAALLAAGGVGLLAAAAWPEPRPDLPVPEPGETASPSPGRTSPAPARPVIVLPGRYPGVTPTPGGTTHHSSPYPPE